MNGAPLTAIASKNQAGFQLQGFLRDRRFPWRVWTCSMFVEGNILLAGSHPARATAGRVFHAAGLVNHVERAAFDL